MSKGKHIVVLGSTGLLGRAIKDRMLRSGHWVSTISRSETSFDVMRYIEGNFDAVHSRCHNTMKSADYIINCIGCVPQKIHTSEEMIQVNGVFPWLLAHNYGSTANILHFSTPCVFSGKKGSYIESDPYDGVSAYSKSKQFGDGIVQTGSGMVIRTSVVGVQEGDTKSLFGWLIANEGKKVKGYTNHYWNGLTNVKLAEIVETIVDEDKFVPRVHHFPAANGVSKYTLLCLIRDKLGLNVEIEPYDDPENCVDKTLATIYSNAWCNIPTVEQMIQEIDR